MRKSGLLFLLLLMMVFTTGCWDATDVNDLYIPFVAGYDYVGKNEQERYAMSINFPVFNRGAQVQSDVMTLEGETMGETRIDRGNKSSRKMAIGDLRAVLLSENLASRGTEEVFDLLFRGPQFTNTISLAVSEGKASDILNIKPKHYQTVGQNVIEILRNADKSNFTPCEDLHSFRVDVLTPGFNPVLPILRIHDQDRLEISGAALFKKYKMVAKINKEDMRVLTWLRGKETQGDILFELEDEQGEVKKVTFEGVNSRSVKAKMEKEHPFFEIQIKLKGSVIEDVGEFPFASKEENIQRAEKALEDKIQKQCSVFLNDLQNQYRLDAILLGKYARYKWPSLVEKEDWDEVFCNSVIQVKVEVKIQSTGEVA
ncbi:Ger(x)C family spore germination protein [Desulforamulus ruminis]|uniref:Germination protein, Ger(X)C family n=1 Tax=Desulforamulus ruminis (strain ATCC 23193 / DSM 2154 / NCIMB 8452 / DL) TaxID=696281 RepID=F6DPV3_DESRL|nr:Ger(x)C family spore germination protein [Desulforamulus ruminis]AEG60792.1 germination protein, Ger(x)C family [Desulforamulus ruminis DSM 2154]